METGGKSVPAEAQDFISNQASLSTARCYERELRSFFGAVGKPLAEITSADLIAYRRSLEGLRPATVCRKLSTIRSLFRFLAEGGYRDTNPSLVLKLPKHINLSPYRVLTAEELRKLMEQPDPAQAVGRRDKAILLILAVNGLRESELVGLDKEDISRVNGFNVAVVKGKGSKARVVKISGAAAMALREWLELNPTPGGPVFVAVAGKSITARRISTRSIRYRVRRYARAAGITRKVSPHALRHAAITHSLAGGANILKVKEMAGHASLSTTQRYLHDLDSLTDNAADYSPLLKPDG